MSHDQLFKDLLRAFFREFLELFLPAVAARLDFTQVTFLDKETFTDFPQGEQRRADVVAHIATRDGIPEIILLHTEIEADRKPTELAFRMFEYYVTLRLRYRVPVYPIVVYLSSGTGGITREQYSESLFGEDLLTLSFAALGLPDLSAEDYLGLNQPLAAALSSLMHPATMGKGMQKYSSLRLVATSNLDDARKAMLANIVETYMELGATEKAQFETLLAQELQPEVSEMISVYEQRGEERGIVKGYQQALLAMLHTKFRTVPATVVAKVEKMEKPDELNTLIVKATTANSLEEMGLTEN